MKACGLSGVFLQDRRILIGEIEDRFYRYKGKNSIKRKLVYIKDLINLYILVVDSSLIKAYKGKLWHKSSIRKGIVPCFGIDADARWGYSRTRGGIIGYKLYIVSRY